jgi:hypothetical protein
MFKRGVRSKQRTFVKRPISVGRRLAADIHAGKVIAIAISL